MQHRQEFPKGSRRNISKRTPVKFSTLKLLLRIGRSQQHCFSGVSVMSHKRLEWQVQLTTPKVKRSRGRPRIRRSDTTALTWLGLVLAWSQRSCQRLLKTMVFRGLLGLLIPRFSPTEKLVRNSKFEKDYKLFRKNRNAVNSVPCRYWY